MPVLEKWGPERTFFFFIFCSANALVFVSAAVKALN